MPAIPRMPRQLSCNKVVKNAGRLKGLKIRVPETALWRRTFELMGASPTPLPFPEVFQALKSRIIDGQENPIALTYNSGIFDANTHLSLTEHMMQDNCLLMAESVYQRLTPEQKAHVDQASRDMEAELRPKVEDDDKRILELVKKKKIVITEVDKDAFRKSVEKLAEEFPAGKRWVERIAPSRDGRAVRPRERSSDGRPPHQELRPDRVGREGRYRRRSSARSW